MKNLLDVKKQDEAPIYSCPGGRVCEKVDEGSWEPIWREGSRGIGGNFVDTTWPSPHGKAQTLLRTQSKRNTDCVLILLLTFYIFIYFTAIYHSYSLITILNKRKDESLYNLQRPLV